jgi:hypothetical protein
VKAGLPTLIEKLRCPQCWRSSPFPFAERLEAILLDCVICRRSADFAGRAQTAIRTTVKMIAP